MLRPHPHTFCPICHLIRACQFSRPLNTIVLPLSLFKTNSLLTTGRHPNHIAVPPLLLKEPLSNRYLVYSSTLNFLSMLSTSASIYDGVTPLSFDCSCVKKTKMFFLTKFTWTMATNPDTEPGGREKSLVCLLFQQRWPRKKPVY